MNSVEDVRAGFRLLIAEALHNRANKIGNKYKWLYGSACGVLFDFDSKSDNQQAKFYYMKKIDHLRNMILIHFILYVLIA